MDKTIPDHQPLDDYLRALVHEVVRQVIAECGQSAAPRLYDPDQVAEILRVPKRWIYERTADGGIPHQKLGKFIRFTDADLRSLIDQRKARQ
jgi:excisionase family DNA binding protein